MSMKPAPRIVRAVFPVVLGLVAGALFAEAGVRALGIAPRVYRIASGVHRISEDPDLRYEPIPYTEFEGEAINGDGRRDFHYPREKRSGVFRIAWLGDSVTYGWASFLWEAHPKVAERVLNARAGAGASHVEVFNFGVRGYGAPEIVACLRAKALAVDPDLVVWSYNHNDPDPYSVDILDLLGQQTGADEAFLSSGGAWRRGLRGALLGHSKLFALVRYRLAEAMHRDAARNSEGLRLLAQREKLSYEALRENYFFRVFAEHRDRVRNAIDGFARLARERGVPAAMVIVPLLDDLTDYRYEPLHAGIAQMAAARGIVTIDPLAEFRQAAGARPDVALGVDHNHPSEAGQRLLGIVVARALAARGLVGAARGDADEMSFDASAFADDFPIDADLAARDMFHIEWGFRQLVLDNPDDAVNAFLAARRINPNNPLADKGLRRAFDATRDAALRRAIVETLGGPAAFAR
ncbi:SGNH/GDSL hydrolase family protein [bacterium]|nr:SGNH/GDSL hydrolase family protein [bacterium]